LCGQLVGARNAFLEGFAAEVDLDGDEVTLTLYDLPPD
jgi:hypothetical protein